MQEFETVGSPLLQASLWRGALLWAVALYIPLSGPLARLEASMEESPLPENWRQITLVISSLLLALMVGLVTQLGASWVLGPGWGSSLAVIAIGWSLLLIAAERSGSD